MFPVPLPAPLAQLSRNHRTHCHPSYRTDYQTSPSTSSSSLGDARKPSSQTSFSSLQLINHIRNIWAKITILVSCSTQLSMKFQLLIKLKILKNIFLAFKLSYVAFIMLINVEMPTIVSISTFMSMMISMLSSFEHKKKFYNLGPDIVAC